MERILSRGGARLLRKCADKIPNRFSVEVVLLSIKIIIFLVLIQLKGIVWRVRVTKITPYAGLVLMATTFSLTKIVVHGSNSVGGKNVKIMTDSQV